MQGARNNFADNQERSTDGSFSRLVYRQSTRVRVCIFLCIFVYAVSKTIPVGKFSTTVVFYAHRFYRQSPTSFGGTTFARFALGSRTNTGAPIAVSSRQER